MGVIHEQVTQVCEVEELEHRRVIGAERSKCEACEALLVAQLKAASGQVKL